MEKFEKAGEEAVDILEILADGAVCERRKMFGCPALFINGNMFSGVFASRLFFRIPPADQPRWEKKYPMLKVFEPVLGRAMREYLELEGRQEGLAAMKELFAAATAYASVLPAKTPKPRRGA
jgi:hypothetical protein